MSRHLDLNTAINVKTALKVLSPGMYTARYISSQIKGKPEGSGSRANIPLAFSQAPIQVEGEIEFVCPEHITHKTLSAPGDYLLVNVKGGDAVLAVSKYSPKALTDAVDVHWRIEPLSQATQDRSSLGENKPIGPSSLGPSSVNNTSASPYQGGQLSLQGHIERRGDVQVPAGEWLGDPQGTARLEGLRMVWRQQPDNVTLMAGCKAGENTQQIKNDQYLGTRQQATPITQLAVFLTGSDAHTYQLEGEAAFSDGSRQSLGKSTASIGSKGSYLVAVRLSITGYAQQEEMPSTAQKAPSPSSARSRWLDPQATHITQH